MRFCIGLCNLHTLEFEECSASFWDTLQKTNTLNPKYGIYEYLSEATHFVRPYFDIDHHLTQTISPIYIQEYIADIISNLSNFFDTDKIKVFGGVRKTKNTQKLSIHVHIIGYKTTRANLRRLVDHLQGDFDKAVYSATNQKFRIIGSVKDGETCESALMPYMNDGSFATNITLSDWQVSCIQNVLQSDKEWDFIDNHAYDKRYECTSNLPDVAEMRTILCKLDQRYVDNYVEWQKIGMALKNLKYPYQLFHDFSKRSEKNGNVKKTWDTSGNKSFNGRPIGLGTIMAFLKESDSDHYEYMRHKIFNDKEVDSVVSETTSLSNSKNHWKQSVILLSEYCETHGFAFCDHGIYHKISEMYYEKLEFNQTNSEESDERVLFLDKYFFPKYSDNESVIWVALQPHKVVDLAKTTKRNIFGFKQFQYDRNIVAFNDGFLDVIKWKFKYYTEGIPENCYAKVKFNVDFDMKWLTADWKDIIAPNYERVWNAQLEDEEVKMVAYGLLGQLHFPKKHNNFQVGLYVKGVPDCGKSTAIDPIQSLFPAEMVGRFNHKERTFGMASILGKYVCIDLDAPADLVQSMEKTCFQKLVSGEENTIPIKYRSKGWTGILDMHLLICSNYMQDVKEAGEIQRRLATVFFRTVDGKDTRLRERIQKELHLIFMKTIRAYHAILDKYGDRPFSEWGIEYFDQQKEEALFNNNPIYKFIEDSSEFSILNGCYTKYASFERAFKLANKNAKLTTSDQSFEKMGLSVKLIACCKHCFMPHVKGCCNNYDRSERTTKRMIVNLKHHICGEYEPLSVVQT